MASSLVKALRAGHQAGVLVEQSSRAVALLPAHNAKIHTTKPDQGVLTMPERLQHIPEAAVRIFKKITPKY